MPIARTATLTIRIAVDSTFICGGVAVLALLATLLPHVRTDDLRQSQRCGTGVVAIGEHEVKITPALAALAQWQGLEHAALHEGAEEADGVEVADLARDAAREPGRVEPGQGRDAAPGVDHRVPRRGDIVAARAHAAEPGDDDAAWSDRRRQRQAHAGAPSTDQETWATM